MRLRWIVNRLVTRSVSNRVFWSSNAILRRERTIERKKNYFSGSKFFYEEGAKTECIMEACHAQVVSERQSLKYCIAGGPDVRKEEEWDGGGMRKVCATWTYLSFMFLLFALSAFAAPSSVHFTVTLLYILPHISPLFVFPEGPKIYDFLFLNVQSAEKYDHERASRSLFFFYQASVLYFISCLFAPPIGSMLDFEFGIWQILDSKSNWDERRIPALF